MSEKIGVSDKLQRMRREASRPFDTRTRRIVDVDSHEDLSREARFTGVSQIDFHITVPADLSSARPGWLFDYAPTTVLTVLYLASAIGAQINPRTDQVVRDTAGNLTAYVTIVFNIIFSPFRFLLMAIPGSQSNFTSWLKSMFRHLLVFPVVFFMLMFAALFGASAGTDGLWKTTSGPRDNPNSNVWNIFGPADAPNGVFDPSDKNAFWAPPALGNWGAALSQLMMLGIILTIPRASSMVSEAMQIKPGSSEGAAGEEVKRAAGRIPIVGSLVGR